MPRTATKLVIVVRPAPGRRRLPEVLSWLRALAPTALLLVAPVQLAELDDAEVVTLDCADGLDGPLSVADFLARQLGR